MLLYLSKTFSLSFCYFGTIIFPQAGRTEWVVQKYINAFEIKLILIVWSGNPEDEVCAKKLSAAFGTSLNESVNELQMT